MQLMLNCSTGLHEEAVQKVGHKKKAVKSESHLRGEGAGEKMLVR